MQLPLSRAIVKGFKDDVPGPEPNPLIWETTMSLLVSEMDDKEKGEVRKGFEQAIQASLQERTLGTSNQDACLLITGFYRLAKNVPGLKGHRFLEPWPSMKYDVLRYFSFMYANPGVPMLPSDHKPLSILNCHLIWHTMTSEALNISIRLFNAFQMTQDEICGWEKPGVVSFHFTEELFLSPNTTSLSLLAA